jgi:hypothetical protein
MNKEEHFNRFLDAIEDYLSTEGWYTQGYYIRQKCKTFEEVEKYLTDHCYTKIESKQIVDRIKAGTL